METVQKQNLFKRPWMQSVAGIVLVLVVAGGVITYRILTSRISIDRSVVIAPFIVVGPQVSGVLDQVYVKEGDTVEVGSSLARVGGEILSAKISGIVVDVKNVPGQVFAPGQGVVTMIDPKELRVVGTLKETDGLSQISKGDPVSFTVDAFSGKNYTGVVELVSPTSHESGVVFNISDTREVKEFDVTVAYDTTSYPEFKNGMSAKMLVYPKK